MSPEILAAFTLQLQRLLKTMLGAALSASKPSAQSRSRKSGDNGGRNETNGGSPSNANDVDTLKRMYGSALKLTEGNDLGVLYSMWYS